MSDRRSVMRMGERIAICRWGGQGRPFRGGCIGVKTRRKEGGQCHRSGRNGIHTEEIASTRVLTSAWAPSIGGRDVSVGRLGQKRVQCGCSPRHGAG